MSPASSETDAGSHDIKHGAFCHSHNQVFDFRYLIMSAPLTAPFIIRFNTTTNDCFLLQSSPFAKKRKERLSNITKQHIYSWPTPSTLCLKKPPSPQCQLAPGDLLNLFFSTFGAADTPVKNLLHIHEKCNNVQNKRYFRENFHRHPPTENYF